MTHINQRRDDSASWASANPVLQLGEVGWEIDTRRPKLGDGTTPWNSLPYAAPGLITSVNGDTGPAVVLDKSDIGLGNVNNTADMDKPVSVAQAATLAPKASPVFTGNPTAPTPALGDVSTSIATTEFVDEALNSEAAFSIYARIQRVTNQTINSGSTTTVNFTEEASPGANPPTFADIANNRLVIPSKGLYLIDAQISWTNDGSATGIRQVAILRNGADYKISRLPSAGTTFGYSSITALAPLNQGDLLTMTAFQTSGSGKPVGDMTYLAAARLGSTM
jgi:hypothetical protein